MGLDLLWKIPLGLVALGMALILFLLLQYWIVKGMRHLFRKPPTSSAIPTTGAATSTDDLRCRYCGGHFPPHFDDMD